MTFAVVTYLLMNIIKLAVRKWSTVIAISVVTVVGEQVLIHIIGLAVRKLQLDDRGGGGESANAINRTCRN